jgi:hypothetical protein
MTTPRGLAVLLGVGLILAACSDSSGGESTATTAATTATTVAAGPPAFLAEVKQMEFGSKDLSGGPDDALLSLGNTVCEGLSDGGLNFGRVVQGITQSDAHPTTEEATAFASASVRHLCPQYTSALP